MAATSATRTSIYGGPTKRMSLSRRDEAKLGGDIITDLFASKSGDASPLRPL